MSGRIYDSGINPKCDICGCDMWTSEERNFNGAKCKTKDCNGSPIYEKIESANADIAFKYNKGRYTK